MMDIEWVRKICRSLPSVTEDIKWGHDLCFLIANKMFCVASLEEPLTVAFKVPKEEFEELSERPGFIPAPYMARAHWVQVHDINRVKQSEWKNFIERSYELVKSRLPAKVRKELDS